MKKNTRARVKATPPTPVPPQLAGLLALVETQVGTTHADAMGRALVAARAALADALRSDPQLFDRVATFVTTEAASGPSQDLHRQLDAIDRPEASPHNATAGEYQNVYGIPALMLGMALAYVYQVEGGAR